MTKLLRFLALAAVMLSATAGVAVPPAAAQTVTATTGAVAGIVTDSTKSVVPGVAVTLSGPALIAEQAAVTDRSGAYHFSAVAPGNHTVTFALAGFTTIARSGVHVGVGFTATVNAELSPGPVTDRVDVTGISVVDRASTEVTTRFDSERLATLPGARDFFALAASTPGIAMSKVDVGGNGALSLQEYTAYGLRATTGVNRNEVEGIRVGGANGANDNYFSDFGSFTEIAIKAAGNAAGMPVPGTLSQSISKSGGDAYHGSVYADFQGEALQATNIDRDQIARGVAGGPGLDATDVNRLEQFRDFSADVGGHLKRGRAWWYASYRSTAIDQRYAWLLDTAARIEATVGTGKATYLVSRRQKVVAYLQYQAFDQSAFFNANASQPFASSDALPRNVFPVRVWKTEYNAALTDAIYVEARVGGYDSQALFTSRSSAARIADTGANTISGGAPNQKRLLNRPQVNGSMSIMKSGWAGSHTVRLGGEYMGDYTELPHDGFPNPCNCLSTLNNGTPTQVLTFLGANVSRNVLRTLSGFADDTWRVNGRITLTLGLRLDRYQPNLPAQQGPAGQPFAAIDPVLTFNNWGPRLGIAGDVTGDGKTIVKAHYGRFWPYPGPNFTATFNPNPAGWSQTHRWTNDANGNGRWDRGEEGLPISVSGGSASTKLDPRIANTYVDQMSAYVEREVAAGFGVRTGGVLNAKRQPYGTINISRPQAAFSSPVRIVDPGPDGRTGSGDDGATLTAYNLAPQFLGVAPVNLTTNLPDSGSEYYTWEIAATKRHSGRWSLLAGFTKTWSREAAFGTGNDFTPNVLLNTTGGQDRFTTWQAKAHGTLSLPAGLLLVPVLRHQSGTPFARTFVQTLNYGNATIKAEPIDANRTPNLTLFDLRTEKTFRIGRARVMALFDVYNIFNTNAAQTLTTSSGPSYLRPTVISGPRIARVGARMEW